MSTDNCSSKLWSYFEIWTMNPFLVPNIYSWILTHTTCDYNYCHHQHKNLLRIAWNCQANKYSCGNFHSLSASPWRKKMNFLNYKLSSWLPENGFCGSTFSLLLKWREKGFQIQQSGQISPLADDMQHLVSLSEAAVTKFRYYYRHHTTVHMHTMHVMIRPVWLKTSISALFTTQMDRDTAMYQQIWVFVFYVIEMFTITFKLKEKQ